MSSGCGADAMGSISRSRCEELPSPVSSDLLNCLGEELAGLSSILAEVSDMFRATQKPEVLCFTSWDGKLNYPNILQYFRSVKLEVCAFCQSINNKAVFASGSPWVKCCF